MIILLMFLLSAVETVELIPTEPMIEEVDTAEYIVGPGDILWFSIQGGIPSELSGMGSGSIIYLTITPDGYAVIPSAGAWFVAGLRLQEATDIIEYGFSSRFPGLRGLAGLAAVRTFRVPLTGQVASQGIYDVSGASRLTDLLDHAGGIVSAGSWTSILIMHDSGDTTEVNLTEFLLNGRMESNPVLSLGDRVHVPDAEEFVYIEGAVRLSGSLATAFGSGPESTVWSGSIRGMIEYIPGETASGIIHRVGGTRTWASRDSCYIVRTEPDGRERTIIAPLDDPLIDPELLPGDRVVCPGIPPTVAVSGYVFTPGVYPHTAGMGAFFYTSQAGGLLREGSESGIQVILPDGSEVDSDDIHVIPPGSTVNVPRKALVGWQEPLLIITSLASIVIAWKSIF
jgi:protein involved in polysaccharide export with SLBB domain